MGRQSESASSSMFFLIKKLTLKKIKKKTNQKKKKRRGRGLVKLWRVLCVTNICGRLFLPRSASKVCATARSK